MKNNLKNVLTIGLFSLLFIMSCDNIGGGLPEDFDRSGQELRITVIFYPTQKAISDVYREKFGRNKTDRSGFSTWTGPNGKQPYRCTIHAQKPIKNGDDKMKTIGHEMFHCLVGRFHPEL